MFRKSVKIKKKEKRLSLILFHHHMMYSCNVTISETATERSYGIMSIIFGEWKLVISSLIRLADAKPGRQQTEMNNISEYLSAEY